MNRPSFFTQGIFGFAAAAVITAVAAPGCSQTGVGDPCRPEREYQSAFNGFAIDEVWVESKSYQCQTRLCLVNHFQGRVTCPYGQNVDGTGPTGGTECALPGTKAGTEESKVKGNPADPKTGAQVQPQCLNRTADKAVYCSCRCANADGNTDDGANYCECPDGFACEQLVGSIGAISSEQLAGGYCIKSGTKFDPIQQCGGTCNAQTQNCTGS